MFLKTSGECVAVCVIFSKLKENPAEAPFKEFDIFAALLKYIKVTPNIKLTVQLIRAIVTDKLNECCNPIAVLRMLKRQKKTENKM